MKHRNLLSLLLAAVLCLSLTGTALASDPQTDAAQPEQIILLHTNDVRGAIENYGLLAALKASYQEQGAYVLLLDAGDFIQGEPAVSLSQGATAIELMNLCGYDAAALGNHEFDYGYANIKQLEQQARFPLLAANVQFEGKPAFQEHVTFTSPGGTKLGIFGLDTPETATISNPGKIQGVTFLGQDESQDLFRCAQAQVDALRAEGCDLVICLSHLGTDVTSIGRRSVDVLEHVTGIDLMIDGHAHTTPEELQALTNGTGTINGCYLTSTSSKLSAIGKVTLAGDQILEVTELPTDQLDLVPQAETQRRAQEIQEEIDAKYGTVFARTETTLDGQEQHVRSQETNLADLVSDAILWKVQNNNLKADAAISNGGNIRDSLPVGEITPNDILSALPFKNDLCLLQLTGTQLQEALEASTFSVPAPIGGFPQVSGITFTINTAVPYDAGEKYPSSTYCRPASMKRVEIQTVGGQPFDPNRVYSIVTNDFLADGGDTYHVFTKAASRSDLGLPLEQAVMEYMTKELNGVITSEAYGTADSRIIRVQEAEQDRTYVVHPGDSLWKISQATYGKGALWTRIYDANRSTLRSDYVIFPGQTLILPAI